MKLVSFFSFNAKVNKKNYLYVYAYECEKHIISSIINLAQKNVMILE